MDSSARERLLATALWTLIAFAVGYLLVAAQALIIPFIVAIFVWYLLNALAISFGSISVAGVQAPRWLQFVLAGLALLVATNLVIGIIAASVGELIDAAPIYQENLRSLIERLQQRFGWAGQPGASQLLGEFDLGRLIRRIAAGFGSLIGNLGLIAVYLLFLFLEQRYFGAKLAAVLRTEERQHRARRLLLELDRDVRTYLGVKTLVSALTSLASWALMHWVGLDFAAFWALLIFVLNFIPNVGSLVATALPTLLALLQFASLAPFLILLFGIGSIQMLVGNVLEPQIMGRSLNMSPLVIILSLVMWGFMWGIAGMFLALPITMIAMMIFYNFENTRWIALLMSRDGQLRKG
ncbi:AI-2E family transporter [Thiohalomonas denitrificans]|uniref:AI-2E family transporter n=1 Tax=Thiohalomonas denitrificans TaxID=415747 RepID=UPI0026E9BCD8|nr:AI-2E family transporter [Thiohalomonas denitrificans]